jgi:outer membrane receptor for ferrienterochelin and colicin
LNADGSLFFDAKTIVATLPLGQVNDLTFRPSRRLNLDARVEHALTKTHTSRLQYQRNASVQNNLGAGDFDLPSRGYSQQQTEHLFRIGDSGVFGKKFVNDTRLQLRWFETEARSATIGQTILVPGAFNSGSAQRFGGRRQFDLELNDDVDYALEKHGVRFGGRLEVSRYRSNDSTNSQGTFQFANLGTFEAGLPTQYTQRFGDPAVSFNHYQAGWYVQDDFRVRKNLTISYGMRQEIQSHVNDKLNIAPRFGFVWSPKKDGSITIRGGAGMFFDGSLHKLLNKHCVSTVCTNAI